MPPTTIIVSGRAVDIDSPTKAAWDNSPISLILDDGLPTPPPSETDHRRHYRNQQKKKPMKVSRDVLSLGKIPFPKLKTPWEYKQITGTEVAPAYRPGAPWMGDSGILRYLTPYQLNDLGYINFPPELSTVSPQFQVDQAAVQALVQGTRPNPAPASSTDIHPIFRRQNWQNTSDITYERLKPVLRLATKFLAMETVLSFFAALREPWVKESTTELGHWVTRKREHYSYHPKPLEPKERNATAQELIRMQDFITLLWITAPLGFQGMTGEMPHRDLRKPPVQHTSLGVPMERGPTEHAYSTASRIALNTEWQRYLDENQVLVTCEIVPGTDAKSLLLRAQFLMAQLLLHELSHAWTNTCRREAEHLRAEPFYKDHRIAETGYALEVAIFGSLIAASGSNPQLDPGPFGFSSVRYPGIKVPARDIVEPYIATPAKHGVDHHTEYAVPMSFVHQFFTDEFWDTRVQRFGPGMLRMPKELGVRYKWNGNFSVLESPTVKKRKILGLFSVKDPEKVSPKWDTLYPKVAEGVLAKDRVTTLQGEELDPRTGKKLRKHK